MTAPRKLLAFYALVLAAVFGVSILIGSAADPIGLANAEPEKAEHSGGMGDGMVPGLAAAADGYRLQAETDSIAAVTVMAQLVVRSIRSRQLIIRAISPR